ncbi:MAG: tetratricopeptide repeat protein [Desulfobacterales bacterium]|nr:tetratricopeptide repeat protein [Desulfobacterales bacterium]
MIHNEQLAAYYLQLADLNIANGNISNAIICYKKVISIMPEYADAYNNLGTVYDHIEMFDDALMCYKKATELNTDYDQAFYNIGFLFQKIGNLDDAIFYYKKSIELNPNFIAAYNNLGQSYNYKENFDEAIKCYKKAISLKPDCAEVFLNMGNTLKQKLKFSKAIACYKKAIKIRPNYAEAYINLGNIYKEIGMIKESIDFYRQSLKINPSIYQAGNNILFAMMNEFYTEEEIYKESTQWWKHNSKDQPKTFKLKNTIEPFKKLKIGYVSPDFCRHSVSFFFLSLMSAHNKKDFEIFCYSNTKKTDEITEQIKSLSDHFKSIVGISDDSASNMIYEDKIDILVDLTGHSAGNRLLIFTQKPAPLQVTWLGYPGTTGIPLIDFRFTDNIADPKGDADKYHSEKLIRLPKTFLSYLPLKQFPEISTPPVLLSNSITFGSFNNIAKLNLKVIETWAEILKKVPNSKLIIKNKPLADKYAQNYFLKLFSKHQIDNSRINLLPGNPSIFEHMAMYNKIDICLDPFPYNGTTTTCEALWMGVPVITLRGNRHSARVGASLLTSIGLTDLIADSIPEYISKSIELSYNIGMLKNLRASIRNKMQSSPLCNSELFAKCVEVEYRKMWINFLIKH